MTEHFPPAFGGTPVLFENIYGRINAVAVTVLADDRLEVGPPSMLHGMTVHRARLRSREWGVVRPRGLAHHLRVSRLIRRLAPRQRSIVHCARALPEGVAAVLAGRRYVVWVHGEDLTAAGQSRELTLITRCVLHHAARVIANSRNTAHMLRAWQVDPERIRVIYPAVDPERFCPAVDGRAVRTRFLQSDGVLLLSVGRLQRRKGHDIAVKAVAAARAHYPDLQYVIVGDGDERSRLEELIVRHALGGHVHLVGEVPADELPTYYAACDIFILPNRNEQGDIEGFGIVFLEAAATGKPAIGGCTGGVPEAVAANQTGLLVEGTDPQEVAERILALASSPELRAALGGAGRERVMQRFTWERAARELQNVHDEAARG